MLGIVLGIVLMIGIVCIMIGFLIGTEGREGISGYECGYEIFSGSRKLFKIEFYVVGMMFIVFDVEAMYLMVWSVCSEVIGSIGNLVMLDFLLEVGIGMIVVYRSDIKFLEYRN